MTYEEILDFILQIRVESTPAGNTRQRVHQALKMILDYAKESAQSNSNAVLAQQLNTLQNNLMEHYSAGTAHDTRFQTVKNMITEAMGEHGGADGLVDVTNLLKLYGKNGMLAISTSDAQVSGVGEELVVNGENGGSFRFTGTPTTLEAGRYTFSCRLSNPQTQAALSLIKLGGEPLQMVRQGSEGVNPTVWSIELAETTSVEGIRYLLAASHSEVVLSHISLVCGNYVGYTVPLEDFGVGLDKKVSLNLTDYIDTPLSEISDSQLLYFWDGAGRRTSLKELMRAFATIGGEQRILAEIKQFDERLYTVPRHFYPGTAVVYLNGQALFEEAGDFVTIDDTTIRITKENINDPQITDKVVIEAIYID